MKGKGLTSPVVQPLDLKSVVGQQKAGLSTQEHVAICMKTFQFTKSATPAGARRSNKHVVGKKPKGAFISPSNADGLLQLSPSSQQ